MKKTTVLVLAVANFLFGQSVERVRQNVSGSEQMAYKVIIENPEEKDVISEWKSFIKDNKGQYEYDKKTKVHFGDDVFLKLLSDNTVDIFTTITGNKAEQKTTLVSSVNLGGVFLNEINPDKQIAYETLLITFAKKMKTQNVEELLKVLAKDQKEIEKELSKKMDEEKDLKSNIEGYKNKINQNEDKTKQAIQSQEQKRKELASFANEYASKVTNSGSDDQLSSLSSKLKDSEKELLKNKDHEKEAKAEVEDYKKKITEAEAGIKEKQSQQEEIKKKLELKKEEVVKTQALKK